MSKKISDFFTRKSIKVESSEVDPKVISSNINDNISVKLEIEESFPNSGKNSAENLQTSESGQSKINENVKTEAEKELLLILPQQIVQKFPVSIKFEKNKPKIENNQCQICDRNYSSKHILLTHVKDIHKNPGSYKCDICKVGFNSKANLYAHQKIHNRNRPKSFKCSKCDYETDNKSSLKEHLKTHERIIERCDKCNTSLIKNRIHDCRLDCKYCGLKFSHRTNVTNHIKKHHAHETGRSFYECDICGLKFYQKIALRIHMDKKHVDGKIKSFTCDFDGKTFNFKRQIAQHMKSHLPQVKCDFCDIKVNVRNLKGHILNYHTGIKQPSKKYIPKTKSFTCPMCFKVLSTKHCLKRHISDHNKTIKCKFCEKLFGTQSRLKVHIREYHENSNGFGCEICGKKFVRQAHLRSHLKVHDPNRSRDLKCTQCDFATYGKFTLEYHLNSHKRKNAKNAAIENPHKCPRCPTVLKSKTALNMHMNRVHPKVLFECDICGKKIKIKGCMLKHLRRLHKIGLNVKSYQI